MATETDAARDRVLAARTALGEEFETLEASARTAVDIPAKVRRNPAKTAAIAGGTAFIVAGGPRRVFRRVKRAVRGPAAPLPSVMLPQEIEKTLRSLGSDGDKVRGTIERDFAAYTKQAQKDRTRLGHSSSWPSSGHSFCVPRGRPRTRSSGPTRRDFQARLAQVQSRIARREGAQTGPVPQPPRGRHPDAPPPPATQHRPRRLRPSTSPGRGPRRLRPSTSRGGPAPPPAIH